jgi:hypothetical protein
MIPVPLPSNGPEFPLFADWQKAAQAARDQVLAEYHKTGQAPTVWVETVWSEAAQAYLDQCFQEKCAFCETKKTSLLLLTKGQTIAVRHLRPIHPFTLDDDDPSQDHPGYFWLAYEWYNLVPACGGCVKRSDPPLGGAPEGRFPMGGVPVMIVPDDPPDQWREVHDESEQPHVLDPYCGGDTFFYDLGFNELGLLIGDTDRCQMTEQRFQLNRGTLVEARLAARHDLLIWLAYSPSLETNIHFDRRYEYSAWLNECMRRFHQSPAPADQNGAPVNASIEGLVTELAVF